MPRQIFFVLFFFFSAHVLSAQPQVLEGGHKVPWNNSTFLIEGLYANGQKQGVHRIYNGDVLSATWTFENDVSNGWYEQYSQSGKIVRKGYYKDGREQGNTKLYFSSGQVSDEYFYVDGLAEGVSKSFYEKGQIRAERFFVKGKEEGKQVFYRENGGIRSIRSYKDGKELESQFFDHNGNLDSRLIYENGKFKEVEVVQGDQKKQPILKGILSNISNSGRQKKNNP